MAAVIEMLEVGLATTVQDRGRNGHRAAGVPVGGALDPVWLACANALVGNAAADAALELRGVGPSVRVHESPLTIACVGELAPRLLRAGTTDRIVASWRGIRLEPGDVLRIGSIRGGVAYLAVDGGLATPLCLGARSTLARSGIGGRELRAGDRLPVAARGAAPRNATPLAHPSGPLRVIWGPQDDHFTAAARSALAAGNYRVTADADRMGMRLCGPALAHRRLRGADIVSDAVTPGTIQVPADGQVIVLLADCQTVGGYAKIATVIGADLPRLAHLQTGDALRFAPVTRAQALAALREAQARFAAWAESAVRYCDGVDTAALLAQNLISGMVDAQAQ